MANKTKNLIKSTSEYVKTYSDIKGVDFSGKSGLVDGRVPYLENMYRDYDKDGELILESVPGYRKIYGFGGRINGLFLQRVSEGKEFVLVHSAGKLYRFAVASRDSLTTLSAIASLKNTRSSACSHGGTVYILDGEKITSVNAGGTASVLNDTADLPPYVPTTYKNGEEREQRNLLTDKFKEEYVTEEISELSYGTKELKYFITDRQAMTCAVIGVAEGFSGTLYVPSKVAIGNGVYSVTEISSMAFRGNGSVTGVITNEPLEKIGSFAFAECGALKTAHLAESCRTVGRGAFSGCSLLTEVYLGSGLSRLGTDCFSGADSLSEIHYSDDPESFSEIEGTDAISTPITAPSRYLPIKVEIPVFTGASEISALTIGGRAIEFEEIRDADGVSGLVAEIPDRYSLPGETIVIQGVFSGKRRKRSEHGEELCEIDGGYEKDGGVIKKCTRSCAFDGRIFLYGNPSLPNTVFFSTDANGLYFGALDFFSEGTRDYPIASVLGAQDTLAVLKKADDGNGSIFYHTPEVGKSSVRAKSYPTEYIHRGVHAEGDSAIFFDDPVFISNQGVCALERRGESISREVVCRSHNVNAKLLAENLSNVRFAVWCGYLAVAVGHHIYLADSRQSFTHKTGGREYEWFFMNGIGDEMYENQIFRFHSVPYSGTVLHEDADEIVPPDYTISFRLSNGSLPTSYIYMATKNKTKYHAYPTEERKITSISPLTEIIAIGELLIFGCENGSVCVFNNDKRSAVPERLLANDGDIDTEQFAVRMERKLHPDFYHFNKTAARYVIKTGFDECDVPYLAKNTVSGSIAIKMRTHSRSKLKFECRKDADTPEEIGKISSSYLSFFDLSFNNFSFDTADCRTVVFKPGNKKWVSQQLTVYSDDYCSPIGIYSINYRFKINGRIKN